MTQVKTTLKDSIGWLFYRFSTLAILAMTLMFFEQTSARAADGDLDTNFNAQIDNTGAGAMAAQPDGKILVGGNFSTVGGVARNNLARLNADGTLDASFNAGITPSGNNAINALVLQPDGKILIGGFFSITAGGVTRNHIARLNTDGSLDTGFVAEPNSQVNSIVIQPGGTILVGGVFSMFNGTARERLAQLNSSGALTAFSVAFNFPTSSTRVRSIALQPDGKIVINGLFDIIDGGNRRLHLARLNPNGSLDPSFDIGFVSTAFLGGKVVVQPDGRILAVVAHFSENRQGLKRFSSTGAFESAFNPNTGGNNIFDFYLQPDGKIIIGGLFNNVNGTSRSNIARINPDGSLDTTFTTFASDSVSGITSQADGKVLIAGGFTVVNGTPRLRIARLMNNPAIAPRTKFDFDGDGRADLSVFRPDGGNWFRLNSNGNSFAAQQFGIASDKLAPADYDGDGRTDIAVYRAGVWHILQTTNNQLRSVSFGAGDDLPRPADFDGDGKADITVFRPSAGTWFYLQSSNEQFRAVQFGQLGDVPMIGDYDADGKSDVAVFRPSDGNWYWIRSQNNQVQVAQFGSNGDIPLSGDFSGDGRSDLAVFRPSNGFWYIARPSGVPAQNFDATQFGAGGDVPVPADYDGDGRTDIAVYRGGNWFILRSANNQFAATQFGLSTDKPVQAAFQP